MSCGPVTNHLVNERVSGMHYETYLKSGRNERFEHMSYRIFLHLPLREVNAWPSCYGSLTHLKIRDL